MKKTTHDHAITIDVKGLFVRIGGSEILKGVDFTLEENEAVGIVGESGSGKTMLVRSLIGLLPPGAKPSGNYKIDGAAWSLSATERQWQNVRGGGIGMVMQDPFTALDPTKKCGRQIAAGVPKSKRATFSVTTALQEVGLPENVSGRYPSQLSGGQRQRVVIAAALATAPRLLIADEATTALDVITQQEILDLIDGIRRQRHMPLILITHNIRLAKQRTDRIFVMAEGNVAEAGATATVIANPQNENTRNLLEADRFLQRSPYAPDGSGGEVILSAKGLSKKFGKIAALDDVNIEICAGECVGVAGQSGSGKTTLARCLVGLTRLDAGVIENHCATDPQIVFQDPYSSLNPAHTIRYTLEEALQAAKLPKTDMDELIAMAEIPSALLDRKPSGLSGGQRQRVAIARALALRPCLLICDESVSALDLVVQNQILTMLERLIKEQQLSVLFITHDLSVLRMIAGRIYVMWQAKIVESGSTEKIFEAATDAYTSRLIEASAFGA